MKNLHNFERLQTMVPLLQDPKTFAVKAGYFLGSTEELKHLVRIVVAMRRIGESFPAILGEGWSRQQTKQEWAKYCYKTYGVDESGRVAHPISVIVTNATVPAKSGEAIRIFSGATINPPARQRWIPTMESDKITASLFMQELNKVTAVEIGTSMHETMELDHILTANMHESFEHSKVFCVINGNVVPSPEITPLLSYDRSHFVYDGINFTVQETVKWLQSFVDDMKQKRQAEQERYGIRHGIHEGSGHEDMYDAFRNLFLCDPSLDPSATGEVQRKLGKARELGIGYGMGTQDFLVKTKDMKTFLGASDLESMKPIQKKESTDMNMTQKASAFFGNLKAIGADLLRVQRGRATLHSAKRVIFSALPFKWGFLARLTGKAKKVENHPFTDLALAFALHGATSFAITDAAKREKYLKYTEEMLVAAGYSASLKMLPIEDMLDKVFAGVSESEAMTKLKEMVKELPEEASTAAGKQ